MARVKPSAATSPPEAPDLIAVRVLCFASLADLMGERRRTVNLPSGATIADALNELANDVPEITCRAPHVSFALNEAFVPADTPLSDGDELALIPPVSGG